MSVVRSSLWQNTFAVNNYTDKIVFSYGHNSQVPGLVKYLLPRYVGRYVLPPPIMLVPYG